MLSVAATLIFLVPVLCGALLLGLTLYYLSLIALYAWNHGFDPVPLCRFEEGTLPLVTIQLPIRNEGQVAPRVIRHAAALDYPSDRFEIQVLDDSDDETSTIIQKEVDRLRHQQSGLNISVIRRTTREGFKAGALKNAVSRAKGELFAIFDADFLIPRDFLRHTVHFFTDSRVGIVQARWSYLNRWKSRFTEAQANKLDAHQMFEQTARARAHRWLHFHGTAGIIRKSALEDAGGWNCISEVEDVELSIHINIKKWEFVYLDQFKVPSELPETITGLLVQQMRWKRGWIRLLYHFTGEIWKSDFPLSVRLDFMVRLLGSFGPALSLPFTLGVLPAFLLADRYGLWWFVFLEYTLLLVCTVCIRLAEERYVTANIDSEKPVPNSWLYSFIPVGFILNLGLMWALTQSTLEGFGHVQKWEVTPKSGRRLAQQKAPLPGYIVGTALIGVCAVGLFVASLWTGHTLAGAFYLFTIVGTAWVTKSFLVERYSSNSSISDSSLGVGSPNGGGDAHGDEVCDQIHKEDPTVSNSPGLYYGKVKAEGKKRV
jgi:cellulose synthase/poly-beta-1,6-N-acetylglucosamine synthase-like glycosyltransferase